MPLTYGYTGIIYFTYDVAFERGLIDKAGKPTHLYHAAAKANVRQKSPRKVVASKNDAAYQPGDKVVFIGASTGGVDALLSVLSTFPKNCPPTLITQHMPPGFTSRRVSLNILRRALDDNSCRNMVV